MSQRGFGEPQEKAAKKAKGKIIQTLEKFGPLRYKDIQEKTQLSSATLTKHLKELEKGIVQRYEDAISKEYPTPVYYRINEWVTIEKDCQELIFKPLKELEPTNGLILKNYINYLNSQCSLMLLNSLRYYFNENKNEAGFEQTLENYILINYREFAFLLKDKLEALYGKGVNVQALIGKSEELILHEKR